MALAGIFITCAYSGTNAVLPSVPPILSKIAWSQNMTSPGIAGSVVPPKSGNFGPAIIEVYAVADSLVSIAPAVSLNTATKAVFVPAGKTYDFIAQPGDSVSWALA